MNDSNHSYRQSFTLCVSARLFAEEEVHMINFYFFSPACVNCNSKSYFGFFKEMFHP